MGGVIKTPKACPGCGTKLEPDWENCPNCPLSFIEEAPAARQSEGFHGGLKIIVFLFVLGLGGWALGAYFWSQIQVNMPSMAVGQDEKLKAEEAVSALLGGALLPASNSAVITATEAPFDADAVEDQPAVALAPEPARRAKPVREWKLRGTVYDLLTLKPVPACTMIFTDVETDFRAESATNARGLYRIILPPLDGRGYRVAISKPGYEPTYLDPGVQDVALMDAGSRRKLARGLAGTLAEPASLQPDSEAPLVTDFHLAPALAR